VYERIRAENIQAATTRREHLDQVGVMLEVAKHGIQDSSPTLLREKFHKKGP
jgi:hypothetical protein